jgi:hypothetical protein
MIDFTEIPFDSDLWELFSRDFLHEMGFHIETPPDRGADAGKDMLVTEEIEGRVFKGRFRWLVSCKHFAKSGKSVNESDDEPNIRERMEAFGCQGFLGFYSTLASAGLNNRLRQLRDEGKIQEYRIFDHEMIENYLVTVGFSELMLRYFPASYREVKPLHRITDRYEPLECAACGKDLLEGMFKGDCLAVLAQVCKHDPETGQSSIDDVYVACKGSCDRTREAAAHKQGFSAPWCDLSDMVIPIEFLRWIMAMMNRIRSGEDRYSDEAYKKQKGILLAIAQKVLRFTTERERQRFHDLRLVEF